MSDISQLQLIAVEIHHRLAELEDSYRRHERRLTDLLERQAQLEAGFDHLADLARTNSSLIYAATARAAIADRPWWRTRARQRRIVLTNPDPAMTRAQKDLARRLAEQATPIPGNPNDAL